MKRSLLRSWRFLSVSASLVASLLVGWPLLSVADEPAKGAPAVEGGTADDAKKDETQFVRLTKTADGDLVALETAIVRYVRGKGEDKLVVDLIGAIHIGEKTYYERLNETFAEYETLLYELVAPPDSKVPDKDADRGLSVIGGAQQGMQNLLGLEYQLYGIDYKKPNFVHADMSPEEFDKSMDERGESWSKMYFRSIGFSSVQQAKNDAAGFNLLGALFSSNRELSLKRAFAEQMSDVDLAAGALGGKEGSTILTERNRVALEKLDEILKDGKRGIGVFYGAAHLPDMEDRLVERGFVRGETTWLEAWNLRDPSDKPKEDANGESE